MSRPGALRVLSATVPRLAGSRPLEGKLAIVTGGSRGIGVAICHNLASKGCSIVLNYTSESSASKASDIAKELEQAYDVRVQAVQADLGDPNGPELVVSTAKNHFSHPKTSAFRIDIIINNAGIGIGSPLGRIKVEDFQRVYAVNVMGPMLLVQAALPYLPTDRSGRIVNLSSVSASCGFVGQSVYAGSKAALDAMTRTWARELAERATVNSVNPGPVDTEMFWGPPEAGDQMEPFYKMMTPFVQNAPLMAVREGVDSPEVVGKSKKIGGRAAYEHEIAGVIGMLCGEESGWCTGSMVNANGGLTFQL